MKLKLSVNLNRIPSNYNILDDFGIAQIYHAKHGVEWNYIFKNVDVHGYVSILTNAVAGKRWLVQGADKLITIDPTADVNMFVFDENEWATNPDSPFPLLSNTPSGCAYLYVGKPFAEIGTYITDHNNGQIAIEIAHEMMHCLVKLANLAGFPTQDVMDTYRINDLTDNPNSNFVEQWKLLAPYINSSKADVSLTRKKSDTKQTIGELRTGDGQFGCNTLELPDLGNQHNISCIPKGTYHCVWAYMNDLKEWHYQLQNVPNRSGIFIHEGNYFSNTNGCILLGGLLADINHDGEIDVGNSKLILSAFEKKMKQFPFNLLIQ